MITLRPYQSEAIPLIRTSMATNQRVIYRLDTGGGKTVIFSEMIRLATTKQSKILAITDRLELFKQTFDAIASANTTISPQVIHAKSKMFDKRALCTVAMVETLSRRLNKGLLEGYEPDLIIIDECHKGNFAKIMDAFPDTRVIGFTATPIGKNLHKYYDEIVENITIQELIEDNFLLPCKAFQMQDDFSDVAVKQGEFDNDQLFGHFDKPKLYSGVVDEYKKQCMGKKALVFNVNIEHAHNMNDEFNNAGIRSEVVTSKTPEIERERILSDYKAGRFMVLNNCSILTTGVDIPSIEVIIINRATLSLALWLQMNGRGGRPYTDVLTGEIMQCFICLDFGMNHDRHGLWCETREWNLEPPKKRKKKDVAPVKSCPQCDAMLHASAMLCPHCGHVFERKTEEERNGVLVEIKTGLPTGIVGRKISELDTSELIQIQTLKKISSPLTWRIVRARGEAAVIEYARLKHYRNGWVKRQLEQLETETAGGGRVEFNDNVLR